MSEKQYRLPDLVRNWPWSRRLSPYYDEAKMESSAWVESFCPFDLDGQKAFNACDFNLLASLTYSHRSKEFVRLGCDLMNVDFVYDEYTDVADPSVARNMARAVIDAMKSPLSDIYLPDRFVARAQALASLGSPCFDHLIATSETYLHAVTQEAEDRASNRIREIDDYLRLRRDTCGARPTLALIEFGLDLPNEVLEHPVLMALTEATVDLIILVNDMHSYIRELSCGPAIHNFITLIMHEHKLGLQAALDWLGAYSDMVVGRFVEDLHRVPSWGPDIDGRVKQYIDGLGQWVRGNDDWSCEAKRYHGDDGLRIKETRLVSIQPRTANYVKVDQVGIQGSGAVPLLL